MRYGDDDRESQNVEDRRSSPGAPGGFPGGRMRIPVQIGGRGGMSITTLLIVGAICLMLGINPLELLSGGGGGIPMDRQVEQPTQPLSPQDEANATFVRRVLADTEDVWNRAFKDSGRAYQEPKLVLFRRAVPTACGTGDARMGPFYCPLDQKVYIDLVFFDELKRRFQAPGDFAQAYVIAHEVGHHVQTLLGVAERVRTQQQRADQATANALQVRMELQADCLAGVWANRTNQMKRRLEPGDIQEGLKAAAAIGDDTLQRQTQGRVVPESFTHGTSEQRVRWFTQGFESGDAQSCDTFGAGPL